MDYRLDLYNALKNYEDKMTEDDAILVIWNNAVDGDMIIGLDGDVNILSAAMSNKEYVNIGSKESLKKYINTQNMILNIAINILRSRPEKIKKFSDALESLKN